MRHAGAAVMVAILIALVVLSWLAVSDYLTADKCLDAGGAWNGAQSRCIAPTHHKER
ncbi:MAG: hypothetical protein ABIY39_09630 [Sphingomonas sp.]